MKAIILDAADNFVEVFEGSPEEIAARIPEGGRYNEFVQDEPEHPDDPPPSPALVMIKIGVFNSKGVPINIVAVAETMAVDWIRALPPTHTAVTLTGTAYEAVEMAGDLPTLEELNAEITSDDTE